MQKQIFALIFALAVSVVINAGQTYAQSQAIRVEVPFDFSANDRTLPAGTYMISSTTGSRLLWRIQSASHKPGAFLLAGSLSGVQESGNVRLTFRRYGSQHFLIGFKTASYQVELPTSGSEKDLRRSSGDLSKYEVVTMETVSKK